MSHNFSDMRDLPADRAGAIAATGSAPQSLHLRLPEPYSVEPAT